mmetsp:Transcript_67620/g.135803  ORF Transcript_67620/g.135803 Transcript_67620/m.135803 type:complete len:234 (-) Transcript_67620:294-995(-)
MICSDANSESLAMAWVKSSNCAGPKSEALETASAADDFSKDLQTAMPPTAKTTFISCVIDKVCSCGETTSLARLKSSTAPSLSAPDFALAMASSNFAIESIGHDCKEAAAALAATLSRLSATMDDLVDATTTCTSASEGNVVNACTGWPATRETYAFISSPSAPFSPRAETKDTTTGREAVLQRLSRLFRLRLPRPFARIWSPTSLPSSSRHLLLQSTTLELAVSLANFMTIP